MLAAGGCMLLWSRVHARVVMLGVGIALGPYRVHSKQGFLWPKGPTIGLGRVPKC